MNERESEDGEGMRPSNSEEEELLQDLDAEELLSDGLTPDTPAEPVELASRPVGATRDDEKPSDDDIAIADDATAAAVAQLSVDEWLAQATAVSGTDAVEFKDSDNGSSDAVKPQDAREDSGQAEPVAGARSGVTDSGAGGSRRSRKRRMRRLRASDRQAADREPETADAADHPDKSATADAGEITGTSMSEIMAEMLAAVEGSSANDPDELGSEADAQSAPDDAPGDTESKEDPAEEDPAEEATGETTAEEDTAFDSTAEQQQEAVPEQETPLNTSTETEEETSTDDETNAKTDTDTETETDTDTEDASPPQTATLQTDAPVEPKTAGPTALAPPASSGRSTGAIAVLGAVTALAVLYGLLTAAWAIDSLTHRDEAMRGVHLADVAVGGSDRAAMQQTIAEFDQALTEVPLTVAVGDVTVQSDLATLGLRLDGEPMIEEAMAARRGGFILFRPMNWFFNLFSSETIQEQYAVDEAAASVGAEDQISGALDVPVEPELALDGDAFAVTPGSAGTAIDSAEIAERLPAVVDQGEPYRLELTAISAEPALTDAAIQAVADELNEQTSESIVVEVLDQQAEVSPRTLKSWIGLDTTGEEPSWTLDEDQALADLRPLFPALGAEDQQARFSIVDDVPIIIPASETVICCEAGAGEVLVTAINRPIATTPVATDEDGNPVEPAESGVEEGLEQPNRRARLQPAITGEDEGVAELESLGIVEQVSTFTTPHACCQNRVVNIQRFADLMQGAIIRPGEEFSLNEYVGQRTREKGFVADGAIVLGNFEPQVGGGISQYATTFFNASFFAGIEFLEYQSHSIYISRYPRGREATISWRRPDLKVRNNTDYGILVWNEYTDTSITVSFYSTKNREVEALPLKRSSDRKCRIDITPRRITFPDGSQTEDRVFASYRPGEGLDCNGNSTTPEEDEPEPAAAVVAPVPEPPPTDDAGDGGDGEDDPETDVLPPGG